MGLAALPGAGVYFRVVQNLARSQRVPQDAAAASGPRPTSSTTDSNTPDLSATGASRSASPDSTAPAAADNPGGAAHTGTASTVPAENGQIKVSDDIDPSMLPDDLTKTAPPPPDEGHSWRSVMCLTGVDYFSTLGYQPGIAILAAGVLAPYATLVLVMVTLGCALPMYRKVAAESPHGDGSLAMLERLLSFWTGKLFVLSLIGFVATGFVITVTLSAADAAAHLMENPFAKPALEGHPILVASVLIVALGAVFWRGFHEAIGLAVAMVVAYLSLNLVVIVVGVGTIAQNPSLLADWNTAVFTTHPDPVGVLLAALLVFPALALGLSGFETGVVVMPLVKGHPADTRQNPAGRIKGAKKLLTTAAVIMSVMLVGSSVVASVLIPVHEFDEDGDAKDRALAYVAHGLLGDGFGTAYDVATIAILWFAGASAVTGLLGIVPRYLPRYGMAPDWVRDRRPLTLVITGVCLVVTLWFRADVEAQAGAYATGVLALMTSAAVAVAFSEAHHGHRVSATFFGLVAAVFVYTLCVTVSQRPEGLVIALFFVGAIVVLSMVSRVQRSTELRVPSVVFDAAATAWVQAAGASTRPVKVVAHKQHGNGDDADEQCEYDAKIARMTGAGVLSPADKVLFLEVTVKDASEFCADAHARLLTVGDHRVLRVSGASVPNVIAAILMNLSQALPSPPEAYFDWSEKPPGENALRFIFTGGGDVPPVTHEVLRRAIPDHTQRPRVHVID